MPKIKIKILLVLVLILVIIELLVRAEWEEPVRTYEAGLLVKDENLGYRLNPGFEGNILAQDSTELTIPVKINSRGLRDDEVSYDKGNKKRILILGDTISFGTRVPYEETFAYRVEKKLLEDGYSIDVVNLGVPAYQPAQEFTLYENEGYKYNPDIVVLVFAMNDITPVDIQGLKKTFDTYGDLYIPDSKMESLIKNSCHTCVLLYSFYNNREIGYTNRGFLRHTYAEWEVESEFNDFKKNFREFNAKLKEDNKTLIVVMYPYIIQMNLDENYGYAPQQKVQEMCDEEKVLFIDMAQRVDNREYEKYFTPDGRIASSEGHREIEKSLVQEIETII